MKNTGRLAFCAILSAAAVAEMYVCSLFEIMDISSACIAALAVLVAVLETPGMYSCGVYVTVSALSILLLPNKTPAVIFAVFAGIYPLYKFKAERLPAVAEWAVKLVSFAALGAGAYFLTDLLVGIPKEKLWLEIAFAALAAVTFVVYDIALSRLTRVYFYRLHPRIEKFLNSGKKD